MLNIINKISTAVLAILLLVMIFLISAVGVSETVLKALGWPTFVFLLITFGTFIAKRLKS